MIKDRPKRLDSSRKTANGMTETNKRSFIMSLFTLIYISVDGKADDILFILLGMHEKDFFRCR
jgi:hypothetical protein